MNVLRESVGVSSTVPTQCQGTSAPVTLGIRWMKTDICVTVGVCTGSSWIWNLWAFISFVRSRSFWAPCCFRTTANYCSCNIFLTTLYEKTASLFQHIQKALKLKGKFYLSFYSYLMRQTSMNVPVIMVDVPTCVTTPLEISTAHVDLDTHYKKTTLLVWVSVVQCYVLCKTYMLQQTYVHASMTLTTV